jgi:predicted Zn-dependent peptidase
MFYHPLILSACVCYSSDTGLFGMYAVCDAKSASHLSNLWMTTLAELTQDVSAEQLEVAKTCLKMNWLSHLDGTTNVCEDIGRQIASHGRRIHPTEAIARIDAVDVNAIKAVANRYFYDRDFALSAIGGIHELPDYNALRSQTYSNSW